MEQDFAQIVALQALRWMAGEPEVWHAFLSISGADAAQVQAEAAHPAMQRAVLAHVLREDDWVRACAAALGLAPERVAMAAAVLEGPGHGNWT